MRRLVLPLFIAVAVLAVAIAPAQGAAKPDLKISKGSVSASNGSITGTFFVKNKGQERAKRSKAELVVSTPRKDVSAERFAIHPLAPGETEELAVDVAVPSGLSDGSFPLTACADSKGKVGERSENNNCRTVGSLQVGGGGDGSTVPANPIPFETDKVFTLDSPESKYWVVVPESYDQSHQTPEKLLVWMHGCGGTSEGDIFTVSPGGKQDWISIAIGGKEGGCWDPAGDQPKIFAAIANLKTHFNIDPHRVILGGYSSGGDIAYRTAFYNANSFAGVLAMNTSPFRDTGSSQQASLAAATWKFNVVHVAHLQDDTYTIDGVRSETDAMKAAGFPITRVEVDGDHYNNPGDVVNGHAVPGTDADIQALLLPHIDDGWTSP